MIRLVLFDIDGTLIRTGGAGVKAFESTFASEFKIAGATEHLKFAGRTDTSLVREGFLRHGIPVTPQNFERFFDNYVFWLDHWLHQLEGGPCPGVHEFVGALEARRSPPMVGLLTGNIRLGAEIKLRHYDLWHGFRSGAFGDDHEHRNCLAAIAKERAKLLMSRELSGDEILVIGDTPLDIECATAIGAKTLAVATGGYSCDELRRYEPTWVAESLTEISVGQLR